MYEHNSILRLFPINEAASCLNKKVKILNYNFPFYWPGALQRNQIHIGLYLSMPMIKKLPQHDMGKWRLMSNSSLDRKTYEEVGGEGKRQLE